MEVVLEGIMKRDF